MAKEFHFTVPQLMAHRGHVAIATVKKAIQRVANTDRKRKQQGRSETITLDIIARRLSKLSIAAEVSGNSDGAIRALSALQSTLQQIRENGPKQQVQIIVKYADESRDQTVPIATRLSRLLNEFLCTKPSDDMLLAVQHLQSLLVSPAQASQPATDAPVVQ